MGELCMFNGHVSHEQVTRATKVRFGYELHRGSNIVRDCTPPTPSPSYYHLRVACVALHRVYYDFVIYYFNVKFISICSFLM